MRSTPRLFIQLLLLAVASLASIMLDVTDAYAQSNTCMRLQATLDTLERNREFRNSDDARNSVKRLQRDLQRSESSYVRGGCNDDAKAGRKLSPQCRQIANKILDGRKQVEELSKSVDTADAVGQQREAILQEMSRFGCGGSSARVDRRDRGNFFDQLFGRLQDTFDGEGGVREEEFNPYGGYHTVRTLCVRKTDGFYWPISFSTLVDYVPNDAEQCRSQCPGLDVDLFYYDNPGQEPEQMINQYGEPYTSLPNAFRFRTDFDTQSKCATTQDMGSISIAQLDGGGTRALITFQGATFPLPVPDPRGSQSRIVDAPLVANASYVDVPLPRPRPAAPGEEPLPQPVAQPTTSDEPQRVVTFGGRRVRIVGPDTPYAQVAAAGT